MADSSGHYFSSSPQGPLRKRSVRVELAGRSVDVQTAAGIFSPEGIDKGTSALLRTVPAPPQTGVFLDIGTGWGPLTLTLAMHSPEAMVYGVEVNERSLQLCRDNADSLNLPNVFVMTPEEMDSELSFDLIWSNPPIRIGKQALHDLLQQWLPRLAPGGSAWLVVQKNLGADSLLPWIRTMLDQEHPGQFNAHRADSVKGFRILRVTRSSE